MSPRPRAAIYARVSVADEDDRGRPNTGEHSKSVARQVKLLRELAVREQYEVVAEYIDDGISGYRTEVQRPAFDALNTAVGRDEVDVALAVAQDRLSRQTVQTLTFKALCAQHNVSWHLYEGGRVATDDDLLVTVLAALAQQESKTKQARLLRANAERAASGDVHKSSRRAFGYFKNPNDSHDPRNYVTLEPTEADAVRKAFTDYATTQITLGQIRDEWNSQGLTTTTGKPWSSGRVGLILRNPRYAGRRVYQGQQIDVRGNWEPITDDETFELVQARLATNTAGRKPREDTPTTLLGGIVQCHCGGFLRPAHGGRRDEHGEIVSMYRCHRGATDRTGQHATVKAGALDAYVTRIVADEVLIGHAVDIVGTEPPERKKINALKTTEADLRAELKRVQDGYTLGIFDAPEAARRVRQIETKIDSTTAEAAQLQAALVDTSWIERARLIADNSDATTLDAAVAEFDALPLMQRREIIDNLFNVSVLPGLTAPAPGKQRGRAVPIEQRVLVFFKAQPRWDASEPGPTAENFLKKSCPKWE